MKIVKDQIRTYGDFLTYRSEIVPPDLDIRRWQLLEFIYLYNFQGENLRITQVISNCNFASFSTIHNRLMQLKKLGYVQLKEDAEDIRIKYAFLTPKSEYLFDQLNQFFVD